MNDNDNNEDIVENSIEPLLKEFAQQREAIKLMINDLEKVKEHLDRLFPESLDKRYVMMFQEKMKAVSSLFSSLLDMRKEISKSIKDEIELRRKININKTDITNLEELIDVRKLEKKFNEIKRTKSKIINLVEKNEVEENENE